MLIPLKMAYLAIDSIMVATGAPVIPVFGQLNAVNFWLDLLHKDKAQTHLWPGSFPVQLILGVRQNNTLA